jgi:large subunit ribosomal protein L29
MQKATQQLTNHSQLKNTRRDIARAKTIQAEQKRAAAAGTPAAAAKKTGAKK